MPIVTALLRKVNKLFHVSTCFGRVAASLAAALSYPPFSAACGLGKTVIESVKEGQPVAQKSGIKLVAKNPKAYHEYYIVEKFEAGIELFGTEVKSIRAGKLSLKEAWCSIQDGELYLKQMHISPYEQGSFSNRDPLRPKRLLMHKKEINMLSAKVQQAGYALVPLSVYFKNSRVKVEIALAKGKKLHDKRAVAAEKDAKRQMDRAMKERNQY